MHSSGMRRRVVWQKFSRLRGVTSRKTASFMIALGKTSKPHTSIPPYTDLPYRKVTQMKVALFLIPLMTWISYPIVIFMP
jgi:hypothetical protein